ncbi:hypothetical protein ACIOD2_47225 [Amycolatopsis sp. NPDC088138]|uniref:hypothetical protein n=1 Tax=Amycolatopsis sp. NPDC088138 TaxID=3363938 RepID=UPI0037F40897
MTISTLAPSFLSNDTPVALPTILQAYGYMRVPAGLPDRKVRGLEQAVVRHAHGLGLHFVRFFFEFQCGSHEGFDELLTELVCTNARHVVVPSLRHFALNTLLQNAMCERLALDAKAHVHAMRNRRAE